MKDDLRKMQLSGSIFLEETFKFIFKLFVDDSCKLCFEVNLIFFWLRIGT
jgi:hypothetical protein